MAVNHDPVSARPLPLSRQLERIVHEHQGDRLSFTQLAEQLQARAWGGLLFIFAAINVLPLPPGTSAFFALPIIIVSAQMLFGRASPWFPAKIDRRGVTMSELQRLIGKVAWLEGRVERVFKPRLARLTGPTASRVIGLVCLLLAIVAAIPVPLFHVAPAIAIVIFGLALIYRDGILVIAASVAGVFAIVLDGMIIGSGIAVLSYAASWVKH